MSHDTKYEMPKEAINLMRLLKTGREFSVCSRMASPQDLGEERQGEVACRWNDGDAFVVRQWGAAGVSLPGGDVTAEPPSQLEIAAAAACAMLFCSCSCSNNWSAAAAVSWSCCWVSAVSWSGFSVSAAVGSPGCLQVCTHIHTLGQSHELLGSTALYWV